MDRFRRIQTEFGVKVLLRTTLLLVGLLGMALLNYFAFSSVKAGIIAVVGLALWNPVEAKDRRGGDYYNRAFLVGLFFYSITLLLGDLLGLANSVKLIVMAVTTVIIYDLQSGHAVADGQWANPTRLSKSWKRGSPRSGS